MDQLKIARHNAELGRHQISLNAYRAFLLAIKQQIKEERDPAQRNGLVEAAEKEMECLNTCVEESKFNLAQTPETPTDPTVWAPPARAAAHRATAARPAKPPVPLLKKVTATKSTTKKGFGTSTASKTPSTPSKSSNMRRTNSQPKLNQSYGSVDDKVESVDGEGAKESFDSSAYDRELVQLIETSVIQKDPNVRWADISGHENTKKTLTEAALLPTLFPDFFKGIRRPWKGICLFGPPGTGKTMLAKALATECKSTFFSISASSFASKYRGDSEKLVRLLFEMARFYAPSTIFIDELDVICSKRGGPSEHEASRRMKGELLVQMDGMNTESEKPVLLLAATNCPWDLDEGFRRRLEKRIFVGLPDLQTRLDLFRNSLSSVKLAEDVALEVLAKKTEGYSGADITSLCRDAALQPMREVLQNLEDYQQAVERTTASQLEDKPIRMSHFTNAMLHVQVSCTQEDVEKYLAWQKTYGAT